jgi:hypothetical protein
MAAQYTSRVQTMLQQGSFSIQEIAKTVGCSESDVRRVRRQMDSEQQWYESIERQMAKLDREVRRLRRQMGIDHYESRQGGVPELVNGKIARRARHLHLAPIGRRQSGRKSQPAITPPITSREG